MTKNFIQSLLCLIFLTLMSSASAETVWVRKGPKFYSNGVEQKPTNPSVTIGESSFSASDSEKHTNTITWKSPPAVLRQGDTVTLTMDASSSPGAPVSGSWYVSGAGESVSANVTTWNNDVFSFASGKQNSPHHAELIWKFKTGDSAKPSISLRTGRYDDYGGNMTGSVYWTYEKGEAPAAAPDTQSEPKITAEIQLHSSMYKSSQVIQGFLRVNVEGLTTEPGEIEIAPYLITYMASDAIEDFSKNPEEFLKGERLKGAAGTFFFKEGNGKHVFDLDPQVAYLIPRGMDEGEYIYLIRVRLKGNDATTVYARAGLTLANKPKKIGLSKPPQLTPRTGFKDDTFELALSYFVEGMEEGGKDEVARINLRVSGRLIGGEVPIPFQEQSLQLTPQWKGQQPLYYATGDVTLKSPTVLKDPGKYVWNFTIAGSDGFAPYNDRMHFTVEDGFRQAPQDAPTEGVARVTGLGKGKIKVMIPGKGWTTLTDGMSFPIGETGDSVQIETDSDSATLELPFGKKVVMDRESEVILNGQKGGGTISYGRVKIYQPGKPVFHYPGFWKFSTPLLDLVELGTIFSIEHNIEKNLSIVEVSEGEVKVTPKNGKPPVTLGTNEHIEVTADKMSEITDMDGKKSEGGGPFGDRLLKVFRSPNILESVAFDAFASLSLIIAEKNLPNSCYDNDPYVSHPTWNGHRKYIQERGREKGGLNALWKTGKTLDCLSNQSDKDKLIADISEVLRQAETGNVKRLPDLLAKASSPKTGSGNWTEWFDYDDPQGNSDWEAFDMHKANVPCPSPIAIECRTKDGRDWKEAGQKIKCSMEEPNPGGICNNADNSSKCFDYEVRFSCPDSSKKNEPERLAPSEVTGILDRSSPLEGAKPREVIEVMNKSVDAGAIGPENISSYDCSSKPGSLPKWNRAKGEPECVCPPKTDWNGERCTAMKASDSSGKSSVAHVSKNISQGKGDVGNILNAFGREKTQAKAGGSASTPASNEGDIGGEGFDDYSGNTTDYAKDIGVENKTKPKSVSAPTTPTSVTTVTKVITPTGVSAAPKQPVWTGWLNRDSPSAQADWEGLADFGVLVPCSKPIAIECRTLDGKDWLETKQKYKCSLEEPNPGGICVNADNPGGCLDYEVRFLCPNS